MDGWVAALMVTAATVGSLHSLAPDHWVPFAALARARGWSPLRTARLTLLCGLGHVTVSAILGIVAVIIGLETVHAFGSTLEANAALLLIGFGFGYMTWAFWRRGHHRHDQSRVTEWSLFLLFCADPCVAVIPMIVAASTRGWNAVSAVVVVYEVATIAMMVLLVGAAHAGIRNIRMPWIDRYGDAVAGALIIVLGAAVTLLGI